MIYLVIFIVFLVTLFFFSIFFTKSYEPNNLLEDILSCHELEVTPVAHGIYEFKGAFNVEFETPFQLHGTFNESDLLRPRLVVIYQGEIVKVKMDDYCFLLSIILTYLINR